MEFDTDQLEAGCIELFGHEYWQVLNDENVAKLTDFLRGA